MSAIRAIASSEMTPGPLGIAETRPNAEAPQPIASTASAGELMQQILTLGSVCTGCVGAAPGRRKRLPAHAPLRTVRESFPSHGSRLFKDTRVRSIPPVCWSNINILMHFIP